MSISHQQPLPARPLTQTGVTNLKRLWGLTFYVRADGTEIYIFEDTRSDTMNAWSQIATERDLLASAEQRHLVCLYDLRGCSFGPYAALRTYETVQQTPASIRQSVAVITGDNAITRTLQSIIRRLTKPNLQQSILLFNDNASAEDWLNQRRTEMDFLSR
ncbi:MAG: hypothetical protein H6670_00185 [Anaerolineaceae bacterium]|nr:hypothetical protein [Anaerolineae bacterium]MCB9458034.1 hypothetical protein [Anaerolineaceae bacterium]